MRHHGCTDRHVTQTVSTTPTSSAGGYGIIAWGGTLSNYSAAHQQGAALISVNAGPDATAAAALPGRSTIYMDADLIRQDGGSGVPWSEASANGYLEPAGDPNYPGTTYAKIDAPGYASWFANKAVALAKQYGVDGIWLDDASASGNPYYTPTTQKPRSRRSCRRWGGAPRERALPDGECERLRVRQRRLRRRLAVPDVVGIARPVCRRDHERVLAGARER
jgi:hypothetical protein